MSLHIECGRNIAWARRRDDPERFIPPLELVGMYTIIDADGIGIEVPCFQPHVCNPTDVEDWQRRLRELEVQREAGVAVTPTQAYAARAQERREEAWREALQVECPKCKATVGEFCTNLSAVNTGQPIKYPHEARVVSTPQK